MRLSDFIRSNHGPIVSEWTVFAQTVSPASNAMTLLELRDHIREILDFIADDLESAQTATEQITKSHGDGPKEGGANDSAAETHAALRLADGFDIDQMVSEYRALRASVIKLWTADTPSIDRADLIDLTRFNEAMDQAIAESIRRYTKKIDHSRNMFLGILGHDLRNPIGAASMSAQVMIAKGGLDPKSRILAAQIVESTARASLIITDLLDLTRAGLGSGLKIARAPMDMAELGSQIVEEMKALNNNREITLAVTGDTKGEWDHSRMGQVFSNLIGNAVQYSFPDTPVEITITGLEDKVQITVHNQGEPIPKDKIGRIFEAMTRATGEGEEQVGSTNLGMGLYITNKIVASHEGTIGVTSSEDEGTEFTIILPRKNSMKL
jgi:signal transduction histidine kinase